MTTDTRRPPSRVTFSDAVSDTAVVTGRNLRILRRNPMLVVFATVQPILFILMFTFVFGGAIDIPGVDYVNYLIPGIFVQTVVFGATNTAVGLAEDLNKGFIERFRTLPMSRFAVLGGRTTSDLTRNLFVVLLMAVVGYLVGFRLQTNVGLFIVALLNLLLFSLAISWVMSLLGLSVSNAEAAQAAAFPLLALFTFASSAFVPTQTMPDWLQPFAENQPVTAAVNATRKLLLGDDINAILPESMGSYLATSVAWSVAILVVFAPLAVRRYRRVA